MEAEGGEKGETDDQGTQVTAGPVGVSLERRERFGRKRPRVDEDGSDGGGGAGVRQPAGGLGARRRGSWLKLWGERHGPEMTAVRGATWPRDDGEG